MKLYVIFLTYSSNYADSGHLNPKSDVYSFGVLLLQIVTGEKAVQFHPELGEYYLVEKVIYFVQDFLFLRRKKKKKKKTERTIFDYLIP